MKPLLALTLLAGTLPLAAQQQPAPPAGKEPLDEKTRIVLEVTRVNLLFTVTDKKGRFVTDLGRNDFEVFDNKKLVGDQTGGMSPYPSIANWPDGNVSLADLVVVSSAYGSNESYVSGPKPWNYMADIVPNRIIGLSDLVALSGNYGYSGGTYITNLTGVTVSFDNGTSTPVPPNGYLAVPGPLNNTTVPINFTTSLNGNPIGALVTFWSP